ncbi:MAG: TonB family protein [Marinoscillum sp.]
MTSEQIRDYLKGRLTGKKAHAVERQLLNDPFDEEAMEGYAQFDPELTQADLDRLKEQIAAKAEKRESHLWRWAATFALLAVAAVVVWLVVPSLDSASDQLSLKEEDKQEEGSAATGDLDIVEEAPVTPEPPITKKESIPVAEEARPKPVENVLADEKEKVFPQEDAAITNQPPEPATEELIEQEEVMELEDEILAEVVIEEEVPQESTVMKKEVVAMSRSTGAVSRSALGAGDKVTGTITDEDGNPLPGVTVLVKGTSYGVTSDINGEYNIDLAEKSAMLVFSYVGYDPVELKVGDRTQLDVEMETDVQALSEVVVTTYKEANELSFESAVPAGGMKAYKTYLERELNYPKAARDGAIAGKVILKVTILSTGEIGEIEIKRSLGFGCDEEAIRLVRTGPPWTAATRDGEPVESEVRVKVLFERE